MVLNKFVRKALSCSWKEMYMLLSAKRRWFINKLSFSMLKPLMFPINASLVIIWFVTSITKMGPGHERIIFFRVSH